MNNEREVKWPFHKAARFVIAITAILWFFIIMLLCGCNENRPVRKGFVVDSYCTLDYDCRYFLVPLYPNHDVGEIFIRDSCGLYEKWDTLWFVNLSR